MKKLKKLLAGLLGAAMVLTSFGTPAWADVTTTPATIDTTKTGSITIHKYEYNGELDDVANKGTGETSDVDKVPDDAKPLAGAGFTIYKVADVNDYYSANPNELPKIETYVTAGKINSTYADKKVGDEIKTNAEGEAVFSNLELGFYVVIETTTPDKVTSPVDPFIVSIPMTTSDGDNWLYDVHVYPKNETTYGKITLEKTGNGTEKLNGVTFVLQKEESGSWTTITKSEEDNKDFILTTNDGKITVSGLSQGTYRFIETDRGNNAGYIMDGATPYVFIVNSDGTITYNNTSASIKITVNNEKPDLTKEVKDRTAETETWQHESDYNVGDLIPYRITIDVPSNITSLKEFTLTDTPDNLDDKIDSVAMECESSNIAKDGETTVWSIDKDGDHGFKITFTPANMGAYAGKKIVITYNAELLNTASTTIDGNPNTAKLEYSNKILPETDDGSNPNKPGEPGTDEIKDTAVVYTFNLKIHKTDKDDKPLADVKFDLYKEVTSAVTGAITGDAAKEVGLATDKYWLKIAADLTTKADGTIEKSGLANGTYYLVETKTQDGFNLLKSPVEVKLNIKYTTTFEKKSEISEDGKTTITKNSITETVFDKQDSTGDFANGTITETIINRKGFELPKTGDIGTALFLIIGIGGMLMAVYIMLKGRKRA